LRELFLKGLIKGNYMICSRCGALDNCLPHGYTCSACGGVFCSEYQSPEPLPNDLLWESPNAKNHPLSAFIHTSKEILMKPSRFFSYITTKENAPSALLFALIAGSIAYTISFLWALILPDQLSEFYNDSESFFPTEDSSSIANNLLFSPLILTFQILFLSLYSHGALILAGARKAPFKGTFKIIAYAQCAMLLKAIPVVGTLLTIISMFFLILTGIHQKHDCSKLKTFFILLFPLIILSGLVLLVLIFILIAGVTTNSFFGNIITSLQK
jgi:hypothetical protein